MKYLSLSAAAFATVFYGCGDDAADETTVAPTTTTTAATTTVAPACRKVTPEGYMTITGEESDGGFVISSTTCDKYQNYNEVMLGNIYDHSYGVLAVLGLLKHDKVKVKLAGNVIGNDEILSKLKAKDSGIVEKAKSGFDKHVEGHPGFLDWLKSKLRDASEAEIFNEVVDKTAVGKDKHAEELLMHAFVSSLKLTDVVFDDCENLLHYIGSSFFAHAMNVDGFCNPAAQPIADGTICSLTPPGVPSSVAELEARDGGWTVKKANCFNGENAEVAEAVNQKFGVYGPGHVLNDAKFHRGTCDMLNAGAAAPIAAIVASTCAVMAAGCEYTTDNSVFRLSADWDGELAKKFIKKHNVDAENFKKFAEAVGKERPGLDRLGAYLKEKLPDKPDNVESLGKASKQASDQAGEAEASPFGNETAKAPFSAYVVSSVSCTAYPDFYDQVKDIPLQNFEGRIDFGTTGFQAIAKIVRGLVHSISDSITAAEGSSEGPDLDEDLKAELTSSFKELSDAADELLKKDFTGITPESGFALKNAPFQSCHNITDYFALILGQPVQDFCDPEKKEADKLLPNETCVVTSDDERLSATLELSAGVWRVTNATCSGEPNQAAMDRLTNFFTVRAPGTVFGDAYHRKKCAAFTKVRLVDRIEEDCDAAAPADTEDSAKGSSLLV